MNDKVLLEEEEIIDCFVGNVMGFGLVVIIFNKYLFLFFLVIGYWLFWFYGG